MTIQALTNKSVEALDAAYGELGSIFDFSVNFFSLEFNEPYISSVET